MKSDSKVIPARSRMLLACLLHKYASVGQRVDLMTRYNKVVGVASYAVTQVQNDFVSKNMESDELVAFVGVCEGLIAASARGRRS